MDFNKMSIAGLTSSESLKSDGDKNMLTVLSFVLNIILFLTRKEPIPYWAYAIGLALLAIGLIYSSLSWLQALYDGTGRKFRLWCIRQRLNGEFIKLINNVGTMLNRDQGGPLVTLLENVHRQRYFSTTGRRLVDGARITLLKSYAQSVSAEFRSSPKSFKKNIQDANTIIFEYSRICADAYNQIELEISRPVQPFSDQEIKEIRTNWNTFRDGANRLLIKWVTLAKQLNEEGGQHLANEHFEMIPTLE